MRFFTVISIGILLLSGQSCEKTTPQEEEKLTQYISTIQNHFVPDRRIARLDAKLTQEGSQWILSGETSLAAAKDSLLKLLAANNIPIEDQLTVWPDSSLGEKTYALARHAVVNLRSERGHSQELATQVLLGTPIRLLKQEKEWFFVQCPDGYLAWIHGGELALKTAEEMARWKKADRLIFKADYGHSFQSKAMKQPVGDLIQGGLLLQLETGEITTKIAYPDGREAYVPNNQLQAFDDYLSANPLSFERSLSMARQQIGKPYLWGGTSPKAMDCSGFTKTLYWQQGLIIPRDASQQVHAGIDVAYDNQLKGLEAGDLLFFGRLRDDGSEKITHVGFYIGQGRFIHSGSDNGANKEESLLADTPDFAPHRRASLLRARRMGMGSPGVIAVREHNWYW